MPYAPGINYGGDRYIYDSIAKSGAQFNNFLAGFLMPGTSTDGGPDVSNPSAPNWDAFNAGGGPQRDPNAMMPAPARQPSLMDRFSAGAKSSLEGFDKFKQDSDESNALEKLLKTMYPDQKARIDTLSLGEKRGMLQADQVQKATVAAREAQQLRVIQTQTALARAIAAQKQIEAQSTPKGPFEPTAGTRVITLKDGSQLEVPYITTSVGGAKSLDEFVPGNPRYVKPPKMTRQPGEGPRLSKDGKFYWDEAAETWKPLAAPKSGGMESLFPTAGGAAGTVNPKDPLGLLR